MRLLLDTHIALWALVDSPRLSLEARQLLLDAQNEVFYSAATIWEVSIKHALSRKRMPVSGEECDRLLRDAGYREVSIHARHAAYVERLPLVHADPFDRILLAQAAVEPLRLVTHDRELAAYGEVVLLV